MTVGALRHDVVRPAVCLTATAVGAAFFLVGILGFLYSLVVDPISDASYVPLDDADSWLHLGLGVLMLALGVALRERRTTTNR